MMCSMDILSVCVYACACTFAYRLLYVRALNFRIHPCSTFTAYSASELRRMNTVATFKNKKRNCTDSFVYEVRAPA